MLYQKYRPESFNEMIGDDLMIENLEEVITRKNRPHAFLFTGDSGCGKTTAARICAKIVGVSEFSLNELNTGNNRGIDTAREIISRMRSMPMGGDSTAFIIDEVHKATNDWQNAMLKAMEDIPSHVYFFLCTTDPQRLIKPLVNRCQIFNFLAIEESKLVRLLKWVAKKEGLEISQRIYEEIAFKAFGSARTALQLLEKVNQMEESKALKIINGFEEEENKAVIDLCKALIDERTSSWTNVAKVLKEIQKDDPEDIRRAVLGYMQSVLLNGKPNGRAVLALEYFKEPFYDCGFPGVVWACSLVMGIVS